MCYTKKSISKKSAFLSIRIVVLLSLTLAYANIGWAQQEQSTARTSAAAKEAFVENAPLKETGFAESHYNAKQQRLREHRIEMPIGPLPEARRNEAAPLPPPPTNVPAIAAEADVKVNIVQNRALNDAETSNATSTVCEPSLAVRGREILVTGNWFASFSRDGGNSFHYRNPEMIFPSIPGRPFCCDQVALYVPSHDLMVWFLQYVKDSNGNTIRIAVAHGSDIANERWRFYNFTPQGVGKWSNEWFDYPDIGASNKHLFITTNCFSTSNQFKRCVALRFSLDELKNYAALNYRYFDRTEVGSLRLTQGAKDGMRIGAHLNLGTVRVFSWSDNSSSYQRKDFNVQAWKRGGASSPGPDGNDWLGFVDGRITAAWNAGSLQGFAWTSAQGGSFPRPHVRAVVVNWNTGTVVRQPHIWNSTTAFAYPAAAVNSASRVGVSLAYGGGTRYPSHAVGALNNDWTWSLVGTALGTNGPVTNRWGDYLTVRINGQRHSRFASTGFTLSGGSNRRDIVARLVQFDLQSLPQIAAGQKPIPPIVLPAGKHIAIQTALKKALAAEKAVKFSRTPLQTRATRALMAQRVRLFSPHVKRAVLSIGSPFEFQRFAKLAELPPAYSFFYERPESVCWPDDRIQVLNTEEAPWNDNCQLIITFRDGSQAIGTGWFLGPRLVITAGHCVHEGQGGDYFKSVEVIPGMNGALRPFGSMQSTTFRASSDWKSKGSPAADYGAILLPNPFKTNGGINFGQRHAVVLKDSEFAGMALTISGYPADKLFGTQWRDAGPLQNILPARLAYSIDTFGGHSGSAVVSMINGAESVVGIHNYGGCPNRCTRITSEVKADLDNWLTESNGP